MSGRSVLELQGLSKSFGGLNAVDHVSVKVCKGEYHAIIGPNGAGKTTLLNLLSGELHPSSGTLRLDGQDITGWSPDAISRAGIGRSFQHSLIMNEFSVLENVRLAAQARSASSFAMFRPASSLTSVTEAALKALEMAGIGQVDRLAGEISHGEQRQLEIAMLLATRSNVMLLDEPTSGMGRAETSELIDILNRLRGTATIILVEHDMDVVFSLADRITVLAFGKVLTTGKPDEVRANAEVRAAYLGN